MTEQIIASQKLETVLAGGDQSIAVVKLETVTQEISPTSLAAMKLESQINATVTQKVAAMKLETLLVLGGFPPDGPTPNTYRPVRLPCVPPPRSRFRKFWSTQPNACPPESGQCNWDDPSGRNVCIRPGLTIVPQYDPTWEQLTCAQDGGGGLSEIGAPIIGATIATNDYVRGLILNILGTNAAQAKSICGQIPGQRLGYWLDDISGVSSGSSIRYIPLDDFTVAQQVQFVEMQANVDMQKLVKYGVCVKVEVSAEYVGNNTVAVVIKAYGVDDDTTVVNSTLTKISNAWVWNT